MKFALKMILATTVVSSALMSVASVASAAPQDVTNATVRFNTNVHRPVSNFVLIPTASIGSSSFAQFDSNSTNPVKSEVSAATSYEAGILAEIGRGTVVFQTGLLYMSEGFKGSTTEAHLNGYIESVSETGSINYLGVPLALKARARVSDGIRLAGRVGVIPAPYIDGKSEYNDVVTDEFGNKVSSQAGSSKFNNNAAIRMGQVFAIAGGGPEFRISRNQNVRIEANYERMLLNMATSSASVMMQSINGMISYGVGF